MGQMKEKLYLESNDDGDLLPFASTPVVKNTGTFHFVVKMIQDVAAYSYSWIYNQLQKGQLRSVYIVMIKAKINLLLPFGPLAILLHYLTRKHGLVFFFSLLGITPLSERFSYATEQLAFYSGPAVGGLLNATFGNAMQMIISIYALNKGMIRVVQQSLLGSILSNMLLVLGCAFFVGGIIHHCKIQVFNKASAVVNSGLLLMAVMGITLPAILHFTRTEVHFGKSELALSRFSSCVMLIAYAISLFFQLKGQPNLYNCIDEENIENEGDVEDDEAPELTQWEVIAWLSILTVWVSILSAYLVDAIQADDHCNSNLFTIMGSLDQHNMQIKGSI